MEKEMIEVNSWQQSKWEPCTDLCQSTKAIVQGAPGNIPYCEILYVLIPSKGLKAVRI